MVTKKQLGIFFVAFGLGTVFFVLGVDLIGAGNFDGIGPLQRLALIASGCLTFIGLSLLPLGNRPA